MLDVTVEGLSIIFPFFGSNKADEHGFFIIRILSTQIFLPVLSTNNETFIAVTSHSPEFYWGVKL